MIIQDAPQSALLQMGVEFWNTCKQERLVREETWYECLLAYNSKFGKTWGEVNQYRSNRFFPIAFKAVENVAARNVQGTMPTHGWLDIQPRTPGDGDAAKAMKALMRWQHQQIGFRRAWASLGKSLCIFGNAPWSMAWSSTVVPVPDLQASDQLHQAHIATLQAGGESKLDTAPTQDKLVYDGPRLYSGNIFDYVEDRWASDASFALRCTRFFKTKNYLLAMAMAGEDGYAVFENLDAIQPDFPRSERSDTLRRTVDMKSGFVDQPPDMVELLQLEGDFAVQSDLGDKRLFRNHILVIANRNTVVRFEPSPYAHAKPSWNNLTLYGEVDNTPYGRGVLEPNLDLLDALNVRWNQVMDAMALTVNPLLGYVEDGVFDPNNFVSAPGQLTAVRDKGNIFPIVVPNEYALAMQDIGFLMSQFNQATGAMESFTSEAYQKSATEVQAQVQMASAQATEILRHLESHGLMPMMDIQMKLNQQLMDRSVWVRLLEDEMTGQMVNPDNGMPLSQMAIRRISPEDIQGDFDLRCVGADNMANAQAKMQQRIQLAQTVLQFAPQVLKMNELARSLFEDAGDPDAYKFIKTDQEIMNDQLQQAQAAQAAQAGASGSGPGMGGPPAPGQQPGPRGVADMAGSPVGRPPLPGGPAPGQYQGRRQTQ